MMVLRSRVVVAVLQLMLAATIRASHNTLQQTRFLNQNNNDDAIDFSWISHYSIRFHSCHTAMEFRPDGGSGDATDASPTELTQLVQFRLCPNNGSSSSGSSCSRQCRHGADYVVELREFLESYLELEQDANEYACEQAQNNCYCQGNDDDCVQACYAAAGVEGCDNDNNNNDNDDFELDRYLECRALNDDDDYRESLYVGAYCTGNGIYLGTFTDRQCTQKASSSAYASYTGGKELPYSKTSILSTNQCMSCQEPVDYDDDANADQYDADDVKELCEEIYDRAAKCERHLQNVDAPSTGGCEYIHTLLPKIERIARGGVAPSRVMAWLFFLTTMGLVGYIAHSSKAAERGKVALIDRGGICA